MNWIRLQTPEQLETIALESGTTPVVIFKHSTTCNISATALARLERNWKEAEMGEVKPYLLDLLNYREISRKIATVFGVEHESPQVLVIRNNQPVYHESHLGIDYNTLKEKVKN